MVFLAAVVKAVLVPVELLEELVAALDAVTVEVVSIMAFPLISEIYCHLYRSHVSSL
jgi:hypothetical protein